MLYIRHRRPTPEARSGALESAMMNAGVIILITSAGGAFGAMLKIAGVGPVIQELFVGNGESTGVSLILVSWIIASLLKISQGSGTVAMITTSGSTPRTRTFSTPPLTRAHI